MKNPNAAYLRAIGPQVHLTQLVAVRAYEPFGTVRLSLYQFRLSDEHAAEEGTILHKIICFPTYQEKKHLKNDQFEGSFNADGIVEFRVVGSIKGNSMEFIIFLRKKLLCINF